MKLFKNFKTKRQLREENERLKTILNRTSEIRFAERETQEVSFAIQMGEKLPIEVIKQQVMFGITEHMEPFIEWDIEDVSDQYSDRRYVKGSVYLAKRKG